MIFSNYWFEQSAKQTWDEIFKAFSPKKILEIGSYEGKSICYVIEKLGNEQDLEIHAIDTWEGGKDHISKKLGMNGIESRFLENTKEAIEKVSKKIDLHIHKGFSDIELARMLIDGGKDHWDYANYFDFIYIDGSHETTDVLSDAVLAFKLLKPKGMMFFDDYLWTVDDNCDFCPKIAIDAFVNMHLSKLQLLAANSTQVYVVKK